MKLIIDGIEVEMTIDEFERWRSIVTANKSHRRIVRHRKIGSEGMRMVICYDK